MKYNKISYKETSPNNVYLIIKNHITVTDNNIHIKDSYLFTGKSIKIDVINKLKKLYKNSTVLKKRSTYSLVSEWTTHNRLYKLGIERERTKDADLNYPLKWYVCLAYDILGI